jgi:endonuclease-3 related protein
LLRCFDVLLSHYGPQGWWPGETAFEVMVGAVLTQNTAWRNAEKALDNLREAGVLSPAGLRDLPVETLAQLLRPSGTFRVKAHRLKALVAYIWEVHGGDPAGLARGELERLRAELLRVHGIGPETADSVLLYAGDHPTFIIDAYTCRFLARLGLVPKHKPLEEIRALVMDHLPPDVALFNEYHALIVAHGKRYCLRREPRCSGCPLTRECAHGRGCGVQA